MRKAQIQVVDLFAGPGGLGEGFSSYGDKFKVLVSAEMEKSAHRTLTLRAYFRLLRSKAPDKMNDYYDYCNGLSAQPFTGCTKEFWLHALSEARQITLGSDQGNRELDDAIDAGLVPTRPWVLIGGPPCQAYSLVGRARARGNRSYKADEDERHYLFKEYIRVLKKLMPAVFVMENVKGILSSTVQSRQIFGQLMDDLSSLGTTATHQYEIFAIKLEDQNLTLRPAQKPSDFVLKTENLGIAQRRHRVILVGVRSDLVSRVPLIKVKVAAQPQTVEDTIGMLPPVRSGLSKESDNNEDWLHHIRDAASFLSRLRSEVIDEDLRMLFQKQTNDTRDGSLLGRSSNELPEVYGDNKNPLLRWLENPELKALAQHETRAHIKSDLSRYLYAACFGALHGFSPKAKDFPKELSPNHLNWRTGVFSDRFRVQLANQPATTITSHISKDGHYFIHPDARQCRSLTVREAARLQSFPDDYLFLGPRTEQYVQIGNAVPPYVAQQIANLVHEIVR